MSTFSTAELCDAHAGQDHLQIAEPLLRNYGARSQFCGAIRTLKVFEDNVLLRQTLEQPGEGGILVVDGGGSHRCALLDAPLARLAVTNGWSGLVIYGCVRDSAVLRDLPLGILALHAHPLNSHQRGHGDRDILITFAGVNFRSGHYLYADADGLIVAPEWWG